MGRKRCCCGGGCACETELSLVITTDIADTSDAWAVTCLPPVPPAANCTDGCTNYDGTYPLSFSADNTEGVCCFDIVLGNEKPCWTVGGGCRSKDTIFYHLLNCANQLVEDSACYIGNVRDSNNEFRGSAILVKITSSVGTITIDVYLGVVRAKQDTSTYRHFVYQWQATGSTCAELIGAMTYIGVTDVNCAYGSFTRDTGLDDLCNFATATVEIA